MSDQSAGLSPKERGPKVEVFRGNLRIRFSLQGHRYVLALGWPDSTVHRPLAQLRADEIKRDILLNNFDPTLDRYRADGVRSGTRPDRSAAEWPPLLVVWDRYTDYKRPQCSPSTMRSQYQKWRLIFAKCPLPINAGGAIRTWLIETTTVDYARRLLQGLNGMGKWAVQSALIPSNPFQGLTIAAPKTDSDDAPIEFWSRAERDQIIAEFKSSSRYSHYAPLVEFLFFSGCRPSEALALQWADVERNLSGACKSLTFRGAIVEDEQGRFRRKEGLKRQRKRAVRLGPRLVALLGSMATSVPTGDSSDLVFPAPGGGPILWQNFSRRAWRSVLGALGLPYLSPYSTRHTMISLALKGCPDCDPPIAPMAVEDVAAIVGNSARVIYQCYAGVSKDLELRE